MRKLLSIILSLVIIVGNGIAVFAQDNTPQYEQIEYIVKYNPQMLLSNSINTFSNTDTNITAIEGIFEDSLASADSFSIVDESAGNEDYRTELVVINSCNTEETTNELNNIEGVIYAEPNYEVYATTTEPSYENQWAINGSSDYGINANIAWNITQGSDDVVVAVIDTGINVTHGDLAPNIYKNTAEYWKIANEDDDGNGYVDDIWGWDFTTYTDSTNNGDNSVYDSAEEDEHGTHIAGIIATVAPNIKILPVKALSGNSGTVFNIIKAIEYAEMRGARIANCSWSSEKYSQFLYDTMNNSEMLFVCSAGNSGANTEVYPEYPASYDLDNIISVGAINSNGVYEDYSNYGQNVDIAAPGTEIYSTMPEGYGNKTGTSMANGFVSGTAALLLSVTPELTATEIKNRIISSATKINGFEVKTLSGGILNTGACVLTTVNPGNMSSNRYGAETVIVNDEIYSIGGYNGTTYLNNVDKFSPSTQSWEAVTTLPIGVADAVVCANDKIIVAGGINNTPVATVQIYDVETNNWQTESTMPKALYGSAYAQKDNYLYVFGGIGVSGYSNNVYKYDLSTGVWETKTNMPFENAYSSAEIVGNSVYLIGGVNSSGVTDSIYVYDTENDTFTYSSKLAVKRKDFDTAVIDGKIYVFGGSNTYSTQETNGIYEHKNAEGTYIESLIDSIEVFDIDTRRCSVVDKLPTAKAGLSAFNYFGNIYLAGGWSGTYDNTVIKYFGTSVPKNIRVKTEENTISIKWNPVTDATAYEIEINGASHTVSQAAYEITADDNEHKIRVRAVNSGVTSMWSDYIYYYKNSTLLDAKVISVNSYNEDKLYESGQERWYKLDNSQAGKITITLSNVPQGCSYIVQLCSASGDVVATGEQVDESIVISNVVLRPYAYYIKVLSTYGGSADNSYRLNCAFVASTENDIPERVKSAVLTPEGIDTASLSGTNLKDISEYTGDSIPSSFIELNDDIGEEGGMGGLTTQTVVASSKLNEENVEICATVDYPGAVIEDSLTQGSRDYEVNVRSEGNSVAYKVKLVIAITPKNTGDVFSLDWAERPDQSFWWHRQGENNYYLTALIPDTTETKTYRYRVTCETLGQGSQGEYTINISTIHSKTTFEDFDSTACNDNPTTATAPYIETNSFVTYIGKLDHAWDRDFYRVSVAANQKLMAYLESPEGYQYRVDILDHTGTSTDYDEEDYISGKMWFNNESYASISTEQGAQERAYMVLVSPYSGGITEIGEYTLHIFKYSLSYLGDLEGNDSTEQADKNATIVEYDNFIGGSNNVAEKITFCIDSPLDIDYYAVQMNAGDKLSIQMDMPSGYNDSVYKYRIGIRHENKIRTYNNPNSNTSKYATFIADEEDTYYVMISSESRNYDYNMKGTLTIAKTTSARMDYNEVYTGGMITNDFIYTAIFKSGEFVIGSFVDIEIPKDRKAANFDNELDVDWYKLESTADSQTAIINLDMANDLSQSVGVIVVDSTYRLMDNATDVIYSLEGKGTYYVGVYVKDGKYSDMINNSTYYISVELTEPRSNLVFKPVEWGTFVYDNNPEFITEDDLADNTLGNRFLMSAEGLTDIVDFQSSHSIMKYMFDEENPLYFDILLYNPTGEDVEIQLEKIGYQNPMEPNDHIATSGATATSWTCLLAWANFLDIDITNDMFIGDDKENPLYFAYSHSDVSKQLGHEGKYTIEKNGGATWLLGDKCLKFTNSTWSPFNLTGRMKILNGEINMYFVIFRNKSAVKTPTPAKLIYDMNTQRTYPTEYQICGHICDCICPCSCEATYEKNCTCDSEECECKKSCPHVCVKEHDVDGKAKGIASSVAEVDTYMKWEIVDDTNYFTPTVYNYFNPLGYKIGMADDYYWVTNFNPNEDDYNGVRGVESDIIPLYFDDKTVEGETINEWVFDTRHKTPLNGNGLMTDPIVRRELLTTGNFGVTERYTIDITNSTNYTKTVTYTMNTASASIILYKIGDNKWDYKIKVEEFWAKKKETWEQHEQEKTQNIFSFEIRPEQTITLIFETILPNANNGGYKHKISVN